MTDEGDAARPGWLGAKAQLRVRLTGILMVNQLGLLFVVATLLLAQFFFFSLYGQVEFMELWAPRILIRSVELPLLLVLVYAGVYALGAAFAVSPGERSFSVFLVLMMGAMGVANYDQSVLDWVFTAGLGLSLVNQNPVSLIKVLLACGMFGAVIMMHYNLLGDDFVRRMLGRGLAAEEVLTVRSNMTRFLVPVLLTAGGIAVSLALVGEFSQFLFRGHGLFPKLEIVLLGIFGVAMGVLLLNVLRDFYGTRRSRTNR